ncbi:hypothetical protein MferCBS31731_007101 [Microsporum ferrugineum]
MCHDHSQARTCSTAETTTTKKRNPRGSAGLLKGKAGGKASTMKGNEGRQEFFFVDETSSKKGKRSHVMKHHVREKRKGSHGQLSISHEQHALNAANQPGGKRVIAPLSKSIMKPASTLTSDSNSARILLWLNGREGQAGGEEKEERSGSVSSTLISTYPQPVKAMNLRVQPGAGTLDPFDTFPLRQSREVQKLADIWTSKLAYWSGQNRHLKTCVFQYALNDMATFHIVILTYSARFEACVFGHRKTGTETSRAYIAEAQRLLEDELQKERRRKEADNDWSNGNITMAMASLSVQEDRYGVPGQGWPYLEEALNRLRIETRKRAKKRQQRDWGVENTCTHYVRLIRGPGERTLRLALTPGEGDGLVSFLRHAESLRPSPSPDTSGEGGERAGKYLDAFRFHSPLHLILASGPIPTQVPHHERRYVIQSTTIGYQSRIASLMYIVAALLDLKEEGKRARFINGLAMKVVEHGLDRERSAQTLLWILLEEGWHEDLRNGHRAWFVGDLMVAVNALGETLQFLFGEVLLRILMGRQADLEISSERFEREVRMALSSNPSTRPPI